MKYIASKTHKDSLLGRKKVSKEQFIYKALSNLTIYSGSIKFVICSACPIHIWREPGDTLSKTKSIVLKRKTSMNGDLSPGKEKDQTWGRCPLPYKKGEVSEKLHRSSQWHSLSFIKAIESTSQPSQKTTRDTKRQAMSSFMEKLDVENQDLLPDVVISQFLQTYYVFYKKDHKSNIFVLILALHSISS